MKKSKEGILKEHTDKLELHWTNDQWQAVMDAMEEYAQQEVKNVVAEFDHEPHRSILIQSFKEGFSAALDSLKAANDAVQKSNL